MAEKDRTIIGEPLTDVQQPKRRKSTASTGTETARTGTGTGTTAGTTTEIPDTRTDKEIILGLADVANEKLKSKETEPVTPTPGEPKKAKRKRTNTAKKNNPTFNAEQITSLLMTMSTIMSQSESGKIFAISQSEAEQIANPLANIISKNDAFNGIGEHSDSIALATACFMIFVPRLIGWLNMRKAKKVLKDKNVMIMKGENTNGAKERKNSPNNGETQRPTPVVNEVDANGILSGLPAIAF